MSGTGMLNIAGIFLDEESRAVNRNDMLAAAAGKALPTGQGIPDEAACRSGYELIACG